MFQKLPPLSERMRPKNISDLKGQDHLVGEKGVLRKTIESGNIPSMVLWGPPGSGKTTIAHIISYHVKRPFQMLSAIEAGVKEVREVLAKAERGNHYILFIDEIHRFNKGQQDALLKAVEKGTITLIGATTENPGFEVNAALLSRVQVFTLNLLKDEDLLSIAKEAIQKDEVLKKQKIALKETTALLRFADGDSRRLLNLIELVVDAQSETEKTITDKKIEAVANKKIARYDKKSDMHYDIISALIKSIRGSDPNAAVYYLSRMIEGGEDVKFIARRLVILASEDIGNANPTALVLATSAFQAVNMIGYPEASIILSQCTTYLASSPKSNASYQALKNAQSIIAKTGDLPIPSILRNPANKLMKQMDYGKGYEYPHDYKQNFSAQEYLPSEIAGRTLYSPGENARENEIRAFLKNRWKEKYGY